MISEHKSHDYGHDIMFHISVDTPGHAPSQQGKDWSRCPTLKSGSFKFLKWNRLPAEIINQLGAAGERQWRARDWAERNIAP